MADDTPDAAVKILSAKRQVDLRRDLFAVRADIDTDSEDTSVEAVQKSLNETIMWAERFMQAENPQPTRDRALVVWRAGNTVLNLLSSADNLVSKANDLLHAAGEATTVAEFALLALDNAAKEAKPAEPEAKPKPGKTMGSYQWGFQVMDVVLVHAFQGEASKVPLSWACRSLRHCLHANDLSEWGRLTFVDYKNLDDSFVKLEGNDLSAHFLFRYLDGGELKVSFHGNWPDALVDACVLKTAAVEVSGPFTNPVVSAVNKMLS